MMKLVLDGEPYLVVFEEKAKDQIETFETTEEEIEERLIETKEEIEEISANEELMILSGYGIIIEKTASEVRVLNVVRVA